MKDCKLVEDLLPLYIEDLLGDTSVQFIEEHVNECENCKKIYEKLTSKAKVTYEERIPLVEKESSINGIMNGYRKWLYSIISIAIVFSLLGGILGSYIIMKYEELVPNYIAADFVKYGLKGDRWIYQERLAKGLKNKITYEKYMEIKNWEEFEKQTKAAEPKGFKIYKNISAQEYGPIEAKLKVGLVLENGGFRVFKVSINDKANYLKEKAKLEKALDNKDNSDMITDIDKSYVSISPTDPNKGEYFVEGRILEINGNKITIEQHSDTHSLPKGSFTIGKETVIAKHDVIKEADYYRKITVNDLKVGNVIFVIFTNEDLPRAVGVE